MSRDRFDIGGKVAIVTGGTRGLGGAISRGLAAEGAKVVVSARRQDRCDAVAKQIVDATGNKDVVGVACDVTDWELVPRFVDQVAEHHGRIDLLVNNAGINPPRSPLMDVSAETIDQLIAVHVKGPLRLSALAAARMAQTGGGAIINVTSASAYVGRPLVGPYALSKAALLSLTRTMAQEWARIGVRVNSVGPGTFLTDILEQSERDDPGRIARYSERTPLGRVGSADEIVGAIMYLASAASSYVTGSDHLIDGGGFPFSPRFLLPEEVANAGGPGREALASRPDEGGAGT